MNPFQENIQTWLSREKMDSTRNSCIEIPFVLSSDTGLVREENQDRVAAIYTGKKSTNPLFAIAVADGMGGMREGGNCATTALSAFFFSIIQHRNMNKKERALEAIINANKQVFEMHNGKGGSTLTSILMDTQGTKMIVHVGDTRVYTFNKNKKMERHTIDDSMTEAIGGSRRDLLQFIGMGESIKPAILPLTQDDGFCAITTDGIHSIEEKTLEQLLSNSSTINQASERLNIVSRWCGGNDNATSALFDIQKISNSILNYHGHGVRIWDSSGDLTISWIREEEQPPSIHNPAQKNINTSPEAQPETHPPLKRKNDETSQRRAIKSNPTSNQHKRNNQ